MTESQTTRSESEPARAQGSEPVGSPEQSQCDHAQRVSAYHDGELGEADARDVVQHVAGCRACADQLAFFSKVSGRFHDATAPHLGNEARERLQGLNDELQAQRMRIKPSADVRWVRRLTAAAAILFVIAAGKVIYQQRFANPRPGPETPTSGPADPGMPLQRPVINLPATDRSDSR